jgi:MoaA/NifB/PqqE/SkfB family radical SAM enzyme
MKLEDIGFYTLSDQRAFNASKDSPLWRAELILTNRCSFKCPYCRGLRSDLIGDIDFKLANKIIDIWIEMGLKHVRFSGGEPTLYKGLDKLIVKCKQANVTRIAVSTNGASSSKLYEKLVKAGVSDFSVSLDACCASIGEKMSGVIGSWNKVIDNIRKLSKITYVSAGMVFTEQNVLSCKDSVLFADSLGIDDIRVIPSAQYNIALKILSSLPKNILLKYPILNYRINNINIDKHVRGVCVSDTNKCPLVLDDMAIAQNKHFPCIIYMREFGDSIGDVTTAKDIRQKRYEWFLNHNSHKDPICRKNCLDVCIDYNNKFMTKY